MSLKVSYGLLLLFSFLTATPVFSDPPPPLSEKALFEFAEHLLKEKDWDGAILEFKRYLFLYPAGERADQAAYLLGETLRRKKDYAQAVLQWEASLRRRPDTPFKDAIVFGLAVVYSELGREEQALFLWESLIREGAPPYPAMACRALLWSLVKGKQFDRAEQILKEAPLSEAEKELHRRSVEEARHLPRLSPTAAGLLAAALPGAGHWYLDRKQDALIAFLINGLFTWAAASSFQEKNHGLGVLLSVMELAWYSGNIYSAVNSAHKINRKREAEFLNNYRIRFGLWGRGEKPDAPYLALIFQF